MAVGVVDEMTGTVLNTCPPCSKKPENGHVQFKNVKKTNLENIIYFLNIYLDSEIGKSRPKVVFGIG